MDVLESSNLSDIFIEGMENDYSSGVVSTRKLAYYIIVYYLVLLILSPYRKFISSTMVFVDGKDGDKYLDTRDSKSNVYHGRFLNNIQKITKLTSCISAFSFYERITLFFNAWKMFRKVNKNCYFGYFLDYYIIREFILRSSIRKIVSCEQRDRYITWLSGIAYETGASVSIHPHGTLIGINRSLAHKIYVQEIFVWNSIEESLFKNHIVKNKSCIYKLVDYKVSVEFKHCERSENSLYIGIYSQNNYERNEMLANMIINAFSNSIVFIMLHPLENDKTAYLNHFNSRIKIEPKDKIINLDCVITGNSTIIYDLIYSNYNNKILCLSEENEYGEISKKVTFCNSEQAILHEIRALAEEN